MPSTFQYCFFAFNASRSEGEGSAWIAQGRKIAARHPRKVIRKRSLAGVPHNGDITECLFLARTDFILFREVQRQSGAVIFEDRSSKTCWSPVSEMRWPYRAFTRQHCSQETESLLHGNNSSKSNPSSRWAAQVPEQISHPGKGIK